MTLFIGDMVFQFWNEINFYLWARKV